VEKLFQFRNLGIHPLTPEPWAAWQFVLYAVSDALIAASLLVIGALFLVLYRNREAPSPRAGALLVLGLLFLVTTAAASLASLFGLKWPLRDFQGILKGLSAAFAFLTAVAFWRVLPELLRLPSRERLQSEIGAHLTTLDQLKKARLELEQRVDERTRELTEAKRRFEIALRGSPISVMTQDRDLRFIWVHNPPAGLDGRLLIGKTDRDVFPPEPAKALISAKSKVLKTGLPESLETSFDLLGKQRSFDVMVEALQGDDGEIVGTTSVAVEVTNRKDSENQLRTLLRELTHRSKNLLTVILAIARQTAARTNSAEDFLQSFSARISAMGVSHDLLVAGNWRGSSLRSLIEEQLAPLIAEFGKRIAIRGDDLMLSPEAVQNLGLAFHELAANARRHGALSGNQGLVHIDWERSDGNLTLAWRESGGPSVSAPKKTGFGRALLESVIAKALGGTIDLAFLESGVRCTITVPATHIALPERDAA
jgi:two-component sensor histidine kinase